MIYDEDLKWHQIEERLQKAQALLRENTDSNEAHYLLASVAELRGDMAASVTHLERTGLAIGMDYADYNWPVHRAHSQHYLAHARMPARCIVSLPKSASAAVSFAYRLAGGIDSVRVSKGGFGQGRVVPSWLREFQAHGGVLHDHFPASAENQATLRAQPPARIVMLLRDPVAATRSLEDFVLRQTIDKFFAREIGEVDLSYI